VIVGVGVELTDSLDALIVAVPAPAAVTVAEAPLPVTVRTALSLEVQAIVRPVSTPPLASVVVAVSCWVSPTVIGVVGDETVTAATGAGVTVNGALPVFPSLVAMMFEVPTATAVTKPSEDTVATDASLELHTIARPVRTLLFASSVVALPCDVPTAVIELGVRLTVTVATGTGLTLITGVITDGADSLEAVIVAVPNPAAVTVIVAPLAPLIELAELTESTAELLEIQFTVRPLRV